jgi:hypothetical protein
MPSRGPWTSPSRTHHSQPCPRLNCILQHIPGRCSRTRRCSGTGCSSRRNGFPANCRST